MTTTTITIDALENQLAELRAAEVVEADARAAIIMRKSEAEQAARAASFEASRPKLRGNLVVNVPDDNGLSHFYGERGRVCQVRMTEDGRKVLDLFFGEFKTLLMGQDGLSWQNCNPDAMRSLGIPNA